ncbi:MAG: hypothetical protein AAGA27_02425 [Pseudomonadota bacterium]
MSFITKKRCKQVLWFIGLYLAGLIVVGGFIYTARWLLHFVSA